MKEYLIQFFSEDLINEVLQAKKYYRIHGVNNSPISKYSSINIDVCITLYETYKLPIYKIAMLYGVSDATMRTYLLSNNINLKGHKVGKNSFNNYFETIDTPDKAYYLGLIVADGSLIDFGKDKGYEKKTLSLELTESDSYIIDKFLKYSGIKCKIYSNNKSTKSIKVNSSKIYDDLVNLKVYPNKSYIGTCFPDISKELYSHFIRGYFDGDGIANKHGYIGFCGSLELLTDIKKHLIKELKLNDVKITYNKQNGIYYVQWSAKENCKTLFNYLYKDKNDLYLTRKYDKLYNVLF